MFIYGERARQAMKKYGVVSQGKTRIGNYTLHRITTEQGALIRQKVIDDKWLWYYIPRVVGGTQAAEVRCYNTFEHQDLIFHNGDFEPINVCRVVDTEINESPYVEWTKRTGHAIVTW